MGLFGGKTKVTITVATQATRVIANNRLPNSVMAGTFEALKDKSNLSDTVENKLVNSIGHKGQIFHKQAKKQYTYGMPSGNFLTMAKGNASVLKAVAALEGTTSSQISLEYSYFMSLNLYHRAWEDLVEFHGYDATTNKLNNLSNELKQDVYLDDLVLVAKKEIIEQYLNEVTEPWGRPTKSLYSPTRLYDVNSQSYKESSHIQEGSDSNPSDAVFNVYFAYIRTVDPTTNPTLVPTTIVDHFTIPARLEMIKSVPNESGEETDIRVNQDHFQIKYRYKEKTKFITKDADFVDVKESVEEIFKVERTAIGAGEFFPFVYFRWDGIDQSADKTTKAYKDTKALLKSINLDYDDLCYNLVNKPVMKKTGKKETVIDEDPANTATYGKEITRDEEETVKERDPKTGKIKDKYEPNKDLNDIKSILLFFAVPANTKDEVEIKYLFDFFRAWENSPNNLQEVDLFQKIGNNRGRNTTRTIENYNTITIQDTRFKMALQNKGITVVHRYHPKEAKTKKYSMTFDKITGIHTYTFQNTDLTAIDVLVRGLKMTYYTGSGVSAGYTDVADDINNVDRKHMLVPLDSTITSGYSLKDREILYSRAQHFLYNTTKITITKIPWYATSFFKILMIIVLIIIIVLVCVFAPYLIPGLVPIIAAFGTGATVLAFVLITFLVLKMIIVAVIMHFVMKAVAKSIGPEAAMYLSLVLIVASLGTAIIGGSAALSSASLMLSAASSLTNAAANEFNEKIKDVNDEWASFKELAQVKDMELDAAKDLLTNTSLFLEPFLLLGEEPENYYTRVSHTTNPGTACFGLLESFCEILLTLPTFNETIRST